jgi:hypothetical protein
MLLAGRHQHGRHILPSRIVAQTRRSAEIHDSGINILRLFKLLLPNGVSSWRVAPSLIEPDSASKRPGTRAVVTPHVCLKEQVQIAIGGYGDGLLRHVVDLLVNHPWFASATMS